MGGGEDKNKEKGVVDPSTQKGSVTFDWKQLPVSILRAFLIFIPAKAPYKLEPEEVARLDDEAVLGAVIAYDKMCMLPTTRNEQWPGILMEWIELDGGQPRVPEDRGG